MNIKLIICHSNIWQQDNNTVSLTLNMREGYWVCRLNVRRKRIVKRSLNNCDSGEHSPEGGTYCFWESHVISRALDACTFLLSLAPVATPSPWVGWWGAATIGIPPGGWHEVGRAAAALVKGLSNDTYLPFVEQQRASPCTLTAQNQKCSVPEEKMRRTCPGYWSRPFCCSCCR